MAVTFVGIGAYATSIINTTTTLSVPARSGIAAGDLLFMRVGGSTLIANSVSYTVPSGWTSLGKQSYVNPFITTYLIEMSWWWKVADGTEGTQTVTLSSGPGSGASVGGVMYAFRDATLASGSPLAAVGASGSSFTGPSMTGYANGMAIYDVHKYGTAGVVTNDQGFAIVENSALSWGKPEAGAGQGSITTKSLTADGTVTFPTLTSSPSARWPYMQAILLPSGAGWSVGRLAY